MLDKLFEALQFSEKESRVYVALAKLGEARATTVSKRAGINRTTVYDILDELVKKGLVSSYKKRGATVYSARDSRQLSAYLDRERQEYDKSIEKRKKLIEDSIPELITLQNPTSTRPRVQFFEGEKGMREAYEDSLTCRGTMFAYTNVQSMFEALPNFFPDYFKRRARAKIPIKAIFVQNKKSLERAGFDLEELRQTKFLPNADVSWSPEVKIYNNKILISSWDEKMAVIIESKEYADLQKIVFEMLWNFLPKNSQQL